MDSGRIGDFSELSVIRELVGLGYDVHIPWGDNCRHDILVEIDGDYKKVQVKTLRDKSREGKVTANLCTTNPNTGNKKYYSESEVDAYALYYPGNDNVYWAWFGEAPKTSITIAVEYKQIQSDMRIAEDYLIDKKL